MPVYVNDIPYEEYIKEQDEILEEFFVIDKIKNFLENKLPADISYFSHTKLDEVFRELDANPESKSEDYAYVLAAIVVNIGNAARQPSSLEQCYKANIRYKRTISYYFEKYKNKLSEIGKKKIRKCIERQFENFSISPIKIALNSILIGGNPIGKIPVLYIHQKLDGEKNIPSKIANTLVNKFSGWLSIKYYDLLSAVKMYKRASHAEYSINDAKSIYVTKIMKQESEYFFEVAKAVLEDMLKVYDQL